MAKPTKKGKAPRSSSKGPNLDKNALENLTSALDKKLGKRKQPPTKAAGDQHQKRQRNTDNTAGDKKSGKIDEKTLLEEIKALGGDESDLALIQGIDSDDEEDVKNPKDSKAVDKGLKDELAAFSKQLGFAEVEMSEASEEEEEEDGDDDDDDDNEEDDLEDVDDEEEDEDDAHKEIALKKGNMAFEPRADWHSAELRKLPTPTTDEPNPPRFAFDALKQHAQTLLTNDATNYETSVFAKSSHKFLSTIMSSGTLSDKVSALTLAVQESPVHNTRAFDALMSLASKKKGRGQALSAIGALVDLLGPGSLLPSDRRLRAFHDQPGLIGTLQRSPGKPWAPGNALPGKITPAHLIVWAYEDWLKATYFKLIQVLEQLCSDEIEYSRTRALDFVYGLLKDKPEQESNLLRLLVNKLGDRDRKISSRASYLLLQLQNSHPGMKPIIVRMIEQQILLHPSQDHRSKYYAINTLNQTILSSKEPAVAEALMRIFFDLFTIILKTGSLGISAPTGSKPDKDKVEEKDPNDHRHPSRRPPRPRGGKPAKPAASEPETEAADKLVSAILTGVNRAAPFMVGNDTVMESHLDTLFKIAHSGNFNTGIQALLLIQQISSSRSIANDRFYRTLYESLLDPRLVNSSKQALYLNLLLRALKNDVDGRRVKAFAKRILQITGLHQPSFTCGLLYVVDHLRETFPDISTLMDEPEEGDDAMDENQKYDGRKRDPEYSNANRSCLWEVIPLQGHYHPSVTVYAAAILERNKKSLKPDLDSHSLIRFLDKFVYRNAKSTDSSKGMSIMQPLRVAKDVGDIWLGSRAAGGVTTAVNSSAFWKKKAEEVAAEDVFFHEYFQQIDKEGKETKKKAKAGMDVESDDEQEDEVWKALVSTQPGVDPDDDGSDVGFDLDDEDMASDDDDNSPAMSLDGELDEDDDDMSVDIEGSDEEMGGALISEDEEGFEVKEAVSEKPKSKRRKLKDLPMFASVDDYAELLAGEEDM
ncbi:hypothetical protein FPOAC1_001431 [Fusarium poae]|uniref:hypothetical protein n=1 Tax=Fusarium poae TaxID=36050 RepID=UPI001CEACE21|nr:hypothetical protein FPOAC1_001431 [Fusarium poae]KAG8675452.1 hypothetical protein FPOAC1_001431 [Fusarium poae]